MSSDLPRLADLAEAAARLAGARLRERGAGFSGVESEQGRDIKLKADKAAEALILARLQEGSDIPVLAEEGGWTGDRARRFWVVDPLDGSSNYNRHLPLCAVSIALVEGETPVLGVVYDFLADELYRGGTDLPATLNGRTISVSDHGETSRATLLSGLPVNADYSQEGLAAFAGEFRRWKKVRMLGTATLSAVFVARGAADRYAESGAFLWDVAAGAAIVTAAGGRVQLGEGAIDARRTVLMDNGKLPA